MTVVQLDESAIFNVARKIPTGEGRRLYLDQACGEDRDLRARLESLLRVHDEDGGFLAVPAEGVPTAEGRVTEGPGARIGPYKLLEQIGEGGFGVVFMAEQDQPVRRRVALKILKPGMDTRQVVARFEAERQALALMSHPNVAQIFDGGETASGRPYFVMELVRGVPITEFCDRNHLPAAGRLGLFVATCQAVQHAHQKGIIHRDVKPSNVLVTLHDGVPVVKVIDFGVAKATAQRLTDKTLFTGYGQMIGTPAYVSPEQAEMSGLDLDTRSDVYSLGVLLYELLTGTTPIEAARLRTAGIAEVLRLIREEEPPRPSTRLSTLGDTATVVAGNRGTEPKQLARLLAGELDWVVMKALEKDRNRRYPTANALARDVERYLNDEPVEASPPSAGYRLRKFARRNRRLIGAAATFALLLTAGAGVSAWQAVRATAAERLALAARDGEAGQRQQAEQAQAESQAVLTFFRDKVLESARPKDEEGGLGRDATIRAALDKAEPEIATAFVDQPLAEASIRHTMGLSYWHLGELGQALRQTERALALRRQLLGPDHPATLGTMNNQGLVLYNLGRAQEARDVHDETLRLLRRVLGPEHPDTLATMHNLANDLRELRRLDEAHRLYDETLDLQRRVLGPEHRHTLTTMNALATTLLLEGKPDDARRQYEDTLRLRRRVLGPEHPNTLASVNGLAVALDDLGRVKEAVELFEANLRTQRRVLGPEHPDTLRTMYNLAGDLYDLGRREEAGRLYRETLDLQRRVLGPEHPKTLRTLSGLAVVLNALGRPEEARPLFEESLRLKRRVLGPEHPETLTAMYNLANIMWGQGQVEESRKLHEETIPLKRRVLGAGHGETLRSVNALAWLLAAAPDPKFRDPPRAVELAREVVGYAPQAADKWATLGVARYRAGDWAGAVAALDKSEALAPGKSAGVNGFFLAMARWRLGEKEAARASYDGAVAWAEKNQPADAELTRFRAEAAQLLGLPDPR